MPDPYHHSTRLPQDLEIDRIRAPYAFDSWIFSVIPFEMSRCVSTPPSRCDDRVRELPREADDDRSVAVDKREAPLVFRLEDTVALALVEERLKQHGILRRLRLSTGFCPRGSFPAITQPPAQRTGEKGIKRKAGVGARFCGLASQSRRRGFPARVFPLRRVRRGREPALRNEGPYDGFTRHSVKPPAAAESSEAYVWRDP